ncbi:MAG TPA: hypothetical protein DDW50_06595 [Firmicutes bacterium]|nr:hypothetical protein [Bacillota bacterium]
MNKNLKITLVWMAGLFSFYGIFPMTMATEDILSKEALIQATANCIRERQDTIGKFQFVETQHTVIQVQQAQQDRNLVIEKRVIFDGVKKMSEEFIKVTINDSPVAREKIGIIESRLQGMSGCWQEAMAQINTDLLSGKMSEQITDLGQETVNGKSVYELKFIPVDSKKVKEVYVDVDKTGFDILRMEIIGKAVGEIKDSRTEINCQRSIKGFYLPSLVKIQSQVEMGFLIKNISVKLISEIKLNDYQTR